MKGIEKALDVICVITTVIFFTAVLVMVLVQAFAVITLNGSLSVSISGSIAAWASVVSAVTAVCAIILNYIRGQM